MWRSHVDKVKEFIIPKHILDLYSQGHDKKPFPSIWDFGFVDMSVVESTKMKPYFELLGPDGRAQEIYYRTPEYDIYLIQLIDSFELYFLYDSEVKDSVVLAGSKLKKHKIKFEE